MLALAEKSFFEIAPFASAKFAPIDVPDRKKIVWTKQILFSHSTDIDKLLQS